MADLLPGARYASPEDATVAYELVSEITKKHGYSVGITGSTLYGPGEDVDLIVVASDDATEAASRVANEILTLAAHVFYYEQDEDGHTAALVILFNSTVLDVYVYGLPT